MAGSYKALEVSIENLAIHRRLGRTSSYEAQFDRLNSSRLLRFLGRYDEALAELQLARKHWEELLGPLDQDVLGVVRDQVRLLGDMERFPEGLEVSTELLERITEKGAGGEFQHRSWGTHAWMLLELDRLDEAEEYILKALDHAEYWDEKDRFRERWIHARMRIAQGAFAEGEAELEALRAEARGRIQDYDPLHAQLGLDAE